MRLTAAAGNGSVSLSWRAPASNGGSAITSYFVRLTQNGAYVGGVNPGNRLNMTYPGLTNGQTYTFTVHAQNAPGAAAISNTVTATSR